MEKFKRESFIIVKDWDYLAFDNWEKITSYMLNNKFFNLDRDGHEHIWTPEECDDQTLYLSIILVDNGIDEEDVSSYWYREDGNESRAHVIEGDEGIDWGWIC